MDLWAVEYQERATASELAWGIAVGLLLTALAVWGMALLDRRLGRKAKEREALRPKPTVGPGYQQVPEGYRWVPLFDSYIPFTCERCGSSVTPASVEKHDEWHAEMTATTRY